MTKDRAATLRRMRKEQRQRGKLYLSIRKRLNLTQVDFARYTGLTEKAVKYREMGKVRYTLDEVVKLREIAGMTWDEYGTFLESIA